MVNNPYDYYKRTQVETASQGRLILMLYEGALKNLRSAHNSINHKDINRAHCMLMKTQDIIRELNTTLNMNAGEISQNLRNLYLYMLQRLVEANVSKDNEKIEEVIDLLTTLKGAWDTIILKNKAVIAP
ncbi:flagellar export chaperone FliS [Pelosinus baikalensis]|uniref:Flagellar secretion chaperone FliS n=1 Tax=Pelosinus baikalensis TaxID=2892015 RepID=A0ABS8HLJ9_9FIRM|nr:flagellar export chaperone FliS [Pelosinus baikalensis]MCC5464043.1 flagellar export chaperone FliS [Pelosinus baikalensis]